MSRKTKREEKVKNKIINKLIIVIIFLSFVFGALKIAPNFINNEIIDKVNLIINNGNVTKDLKKDIIIEDGIMYISKEDILNFFDPYIYYDEKYNQIITTSDNQVASMIVGKNELINNGSKMEVSSTILEKNDTYYIPFSDFKNVYNVEINYIE